MDPCSKDSSNNPERFFQFDTMTGEILPAKGLSTEAKRKARATIGDLKLNEFHHLKKRKKWLFELSELLTGHPDAARIITIVVARDYALSSLTRAMLTERGCAFPE